jgi:hypothetical protein
MIEIVATIAVLFSGLFLICLSLVTFLFPKRAAVFLNSFAITRKAHFTEMIIRLGAGIALAITAQDMALAEIHYLLGLILVFTSVVLMLVPWQYHRKFAKLVVLPLTKRVWVFGILALPLGLEIIVALMVGKYA